MDKRELAIKLKEIFTDINSKDKKYSKVWLEDANFGGLYHSGKFLLNLKMEHYVDYINDEIRGVIYMLNDVYREGLRCIYLVNVLNADEYIHCEPDAVILIGGEVMMGV